MLIILDKHSGVPIFRQILDQIKHLILTGQLPEGEQLTSVKDLALDLKVNPMTVSKTYSLLEHEGFVDRRRGIGLFAKKPNQGLSQDAQLAVLRDLFQSGIVHALQMGLPEDQIHTLISHMYQAFRAVPVTTLKTQNTPKGNDE